MPEGEKLLGGAVEIGGHNLPPWAPPVPASLSIVLPLLQTNKQTKIFFFVSPGLKLHKSELKNFLPLSKTHGIIVINWSGMDAFRVGFCPF